MLLVAAILAGLFQARRRGYRMMTIAALIGLLEEADLDENYVFYDM